MAEALDALLALAADGDPVTCTLSPESVQVIFFALGFMKAPKKWLGQFGDTITDAEWSQIVQLIDHVTEEMLP